MGDLHTLWDISEESFRVLISRGLPASSPAAVANEDQRMTMLGDGLVADPTRCLMRTTQINTTVSEVWPWLSQMMRGAGVYGWPLLETPDCKSADFLLDGLPEPQAGDRIGDLFQIARLDPPRELVWKSVAELRMLGFSIAELTLDYLLQPASSGRCWIVVRLCGACEHLTIQIAHYLFGVIDFLLPASQLATMKKHVETYPRRLAVEDINRGRVKRHQAAEFHPGRGPTVIIHRRSAENAEESLRPGHLSDKAQP